MSIAASPLAESGVQETLVARIADAARQGLSAHPKRLPPWLFYDEEGSRLFDAITELDEYYLTRTERGILAEYGEEMIAAAARGMKLRIVELGAGSAEKTRLLLRAAVERQQAVIYEPIDVSGSALEIARQRIEREIPGVSVAPRVSDYTHGPGLDLDAFFGERRLVLYIGSSIGNFEPHEAAELLQRVRASLCEGDGILLGVDMVKNEQILHAAYDDAEGVTAAFNRNILLRLNRDLGAGFDPDAFAHQARWNPRQSRMEMHLESRLQQRVEVAGIEVAFAPGETIHTENSYKYESGQPEAMLEAAGFEPAGLWTDERQWFSVCLGRAA